MKRIIFLIIITMFCAGCTSKNPIVTMEIKDYGTIKMELYPDYAPNTVANFVSLINEGFYDYNTFHRLMPNFVLQGGDPTGTGTGGPNYKIAGEFKLNGYNNNNLSHEEGIVSMARSKSYDSAGSQFFIVLNDSAKYSLDNSYAAFGKVIEGMDIIKKIEKEEVIEDTKSGKLKNNLTIIKTTVDTFGKNYKLKKITN